MNKLKINSRNNQSTTESPEQDTKLEIKKYYLILFNVIVPYLTFFIPKITKGNNNSFISISYTSLRTLDSICLIMKNVAYLIFYHISLSFHYRIKSLAHCQIII